MTSKRTKIELDSDGLASAALASEVYDLLLESSRKELEVLLAVFVKASSKHALETVRADAIKRGAYVAVKPSRYQHCNNATLDSFFSFLEPKDLRVADVVCRRWRAASKHGNCGWVAALSRQTDGCERWTSNVLTRRIQPTAQKLVFEHGYELNLVRRIETLTDLQFRHPPPAAGLAMLANLAGLQTLQLESRAKMDIECISTLVKAKFASRLTVLSLSCDVIGLMRLLKLPQLATLRVHELHDFDDWSALPPFTSPSLTSLTISDGFLACYPASLLLSTVHFPKLRELTLPTSQMVYLEPGALPSLTSLSLPLCYADGTQPEAMAQLAKSQTLQHLQLQFASRGALEALIGMKELSSLRFAPREFCGLSPEKLRTLLEPLRQMPHLTTLHLECIDLQPGVPGALPPNLTSLSINTLRAYDPSLALEIHDCLPSLRALAWDLERSDGSAKLIRDMQTTNPAVTITTVPPEQLPYSLANGPQLRVD